MNDREKTSTWIDRYPVRLQILGRKRAGHLPLLLNIPDTQTAEAPANKEPSAIMAECQVIGPIIVILILFKHLRLPDLEQASIIQAPEPDQVMIEASSSEHVAGGMKSKRRDIGERVIHGQHTDQASICGIPEDNHTFTVTLHSCSQHGPIVTKLKAVRIHSILSMLSTIYQPVHKLASTHIPERNRRISRRQCQHIAWHIKGKIK